jgi:hypothetical protein
MWLRRPADRATRKRLRKLCRHFKFKNDIARWDKDKEFVQRLAFWGPNEEALRWIASRSDGRINYLEVTNDYIFDTLDWREAGWEYFHRHLTRRYHRLLQGIQFDDNNPLHARYDAPRGTPNLITIYREERSRTTKECCYLLHVEWRATGEDAVRAAGILRPRDLLTYDFRPFWEERLRFYAIDPGRLGRLYRNRNQGTRSHRITPADRKHGRRLISDYETIQKFIDHYRSDNIQHVLTPLPTKPFLPPTPYQLSTNRSRNNCRNTPTIITTYPILRPELRTDKPHLPISNPITPLTTYHLIRPSARLIARMTSRPRSISYDSSNVAGKE